MTTGLGLSGSGSVGRVPNGANKWFARPRAARALKRVGYNVNLMGDGRLECTRGNEGVYIGRHGKGLEFIVYSNDESTLEIAYKFGSNVKLEKPWSD